ncbi:hypothetical protein CKAN_01034600 [Cinnamomum micranthum f. kanehirae]|uniref:Uncharacterized protein n=1 Tax=Cinnamomum micranthum f. kanehirae TaxID=337451 RepID=A0A443NT12_9MAGN|nr:hypothetical protein CKAN_01034600 [Cinnamomum micranthum f. kanehirae]
MGMACAKGFSGEPLIATSLINVAKRKENRDEHKRHLRQSSSPKLLEQNASPPFKYQFRHLNERPPFHRSHSISAPYLVITP